MPVLELTTAGNAVVVQRVRNGHHTVEPGDQVLSIDDVMVVGKDWTDVRNVLAKHTPSASTPLELMFLIKGETRNCSFEGPIICNPPLIEPITLANLQGRWRMVQKAGVAETPSSVWEHLLRHNTHRENTQLQSGILLRQFSHLGEMVLTALDEHGDIPRRGVDEDVYSSLGLEPREHINRRLAKKGLEMVKIRGDGDCQASSVSQMLYGTPDRASELRQEGVDYLDANRADFEGSLVTDRHKWDGSIDPAYDAPSWDDYIKKVSGDVSTIVCNH